MFINDNSFNTFIIRLEKGWKKNLNGYLSEPSPGELTMITLHLISNVEYTNRFKYSIILWPGNTATAKYYVLTWYYKWGYEF